MSVSESITKPKFVALDSSHLGELFRDMRSDNPERRAKADAFIQAFERAGSILLLTWGHLQELFTHESEQVVARRMGAIASMPMVASVISLTDPSFAGSIIDIGALEVAEAYKDTSATAEIVRDKVAAGLFKLVSGSDLVRLLSEAWPLLRQVLADQAMHARKVVAISRSSFVNVSDLKIVDLLKQPARAPDDILRYLTALGLRLADDIERRGDKRIAANATQVSLEFMHSVANLSRAVSTSSNPSLRILETNGIALSEVHAEMTVGDVGRLAAFRNKLGILNQSLGLPWAELKTRIIPDQLPSHLVAAAIDRFRPDTKERKGSDLSDNYLGCLSPYADFTYVDKRTYEALRQARQKLPTIARLLRRGQIARASDYGTIPAQLVSNLK